MNLTFDSVNHTAARWIRKRFAFPLVVALAAALLIVSEKTYRQTTSTLRGGIALTDARLQTTRELQLLSDAETAQFAYLVTANPEYLSRYAQAVAALPEVQGSVASFFARQGVDGAKAAQRGAEFVHRILGRFDRTLALARTGDLAAATALAAGDSGRVEMLAVRTELATQLARAAVLQQQARTSIYDALLVNRIAVGSLTGVVLLSLFLFLRQLLVQDRERSAQQVALHEDRSRLEVEVQRRTVRRAELAKHLQTVREDERSHLARELHDELGGLLTVSKLELARARSKAGEPPELLIRLGRLNENLDKGIALKRRIIEDLRPPALANQGLVAALRTLCADMATSLGVPVRLTTADFRLPPDAELTVYRFVQEALTQHRQVRLRRAGRGGAQGGRPPCFRGGSRRRRGLRSAGLAGRSSRPVGHAVPC